MASRFGPVGGRLRAARLADALFVAADASPETRARAVDLFARVPPPAARRALMHVDALLPPGSPATAGLAMAEVVIPLLEDDCVALRQALVPLRLGSTPCVWQLQASPETLAGYAEGLTRYLAPERWSTAVRLLRLLYEIPPTVQDMHTAVQVAATLADDAWARVIANHLPDDRP